MDFDIVIVGAGPAGASMAERFASQANKKVLCVERRDHPGGNAYDFYDQTGILVQKYGPHIFHTNSKTVWSYLSQFTGWNNYIHRVVASVGGKEVCMPISLVTLEQLYGRIFTREEMVQFLNDRKIECKEITNSRDVVVSQVGEEIYNLLFRNYTKKVWGKYPEELDAQVTNRLPVRFDRDTRYFTDRYQGIPINGYTVLFRNMLSHKNITLMLNTEIKSIMPVSCKIFIYTGPIDQYFDSLPKP